MKIKQQQQLQQRSSTCTAVKYNQPAKLFTTATISGQQQV